MKIFTSAQIHELDKYTIENEPIKSIDLMERAAKAITQAITEVWGSATRVIVFAGPGNNGGDALAVARLLLDRNYDVTVYLFNIQGHLSEDCAANKKRLQEKKSKALIEVIQEFEPSGVGARDLRECLLLQLEDKKRTPSIDNAIRVLRDQFDAFKNRHFSKIMNRLHLNEDEMKAVLEEIRHLNPSPGGQIDDSYNDQAQQVVPDFRLDYENGQLLLSMPRFSIPELRINQKYSEIMETGRLSDNKADKDAASFVKQKIDSAKWFIEALRQRQNTLESTMRAIIDYQHDYFIDGDESSLRPMVLKDIAEITGFDISTISRVVNSKWIETHFGIFPLKYFFSEGLENSDGEEVSTREIKKALREMVDGEDKHNPLTDDELVDGLAAKGYKVARRTIAKYRALLDIPKARLRREL